LRYALEDKGNKLISEAVMIVCVCLVMSRKNARGILSTEVRGQKTEKKEKI
jgi:hypothetical protein